MNPSDSFRKPHTPSSRPIESHDASKRLNKDGFVTDFSRTNLLQLFGSSSEAMQSVETLMSGDPRELESFMYEFEKLNFDEQVKLIYQIPDISGSKPFDVPQSFVDQLLASGKQVRTKDPGTKYLDLSQCKYLKAPDNSRILLLKTPGGEAQRFILKKGFSPVITESA